VTEPDEFPEIVHGLRQLHRAEVDAARQHRTVTARVGVRSRYSLASMSLLVPLMVGAIVVVLYARSLSSTDPTRSQPFGAAGSAGLASGSPAASSPQLSAAPQTTASVSDGASPGELGFPSAINGEPVLTGADVIARASSGSDDSFLAAGWVYGVVSDCYSGCGSLLILNPFASMSGGPSVVLRLSQDHADLPLDRAVVVRIHRDELSPSCTASDECIPSVMFELTLWTGSIQQSLP
jgi:hypothetical protein